MSDTDKHNWSRRTFIKGMGATAVVGALSSCAISGDRSAKGLTEEAFCEPLIKSGDIENPISPLGMFPSMTVRHLRSPGRKVFPQIRPQCQTGKLAGLRLVTGLFWSP